MRKLNEPMSFDISDIFDSALFEVRKEFTGTSEEFSKKINDKLPELIQVLGDTFKSVLLNLYESSILEELRGKETKYIDNLYTDYKKGFDYLQIFIDLNKYCGKRILEEFEKNSRIKERKKLFLLIRLQSRACQIATEIQTLLKYGYPDGAIARWRTLHEMSVVFSVLIENPFELTEMFGDYEIVEKNKQARDLEEHRHKLNWPPLSKKQLKNLKEHTEIINKKYDKEFFKSYGWTINILPKGKRNFKELEKLAKLDYMRPFYSWSNDNVHSGISGLVSRIGQVESGKTSYLGFAGPSFYGFADPVQFTTTSLYTITSQLLGLHYDLESQIIDSLLDDVQDIVKSEFFNSQLRLKKQYYNE